MKNSGNHFIAFLFCSLSVFAQNKIDRKAVVSRHNVKVNVVDTLASLSVGNGSFAFTVDAMGLQTFPDHYKNGIPLGTQSDWGWDSFSNENNYRFEETLEDYDQNGRKVSYSVQPKTPERAAKATEYFRSNPHRLQLGNLGFELYKKNGAKVKPEDITIIDQTLNLWTGKIESLFKVEGVPVTVETVSHQEEDVVGVRIKSDLIEREQLKIRLRIPYPTGEWMDTGTKWEGNQNYKSSLSQKDKHEAVISHKMDSIHYQIGLAWEGKAEISEESSHYFVLQP
ncbi:hypothetical protein [Autumnicola psychrophila]|uniref:Uncharacterized protein n=1 Tax=Autumnicola psychrophila TaxID=3075592 RepID=A0ABU3DU26_9FLAO|nr:hypothetical protein [Zunongwangia sp. F225]MDT0687205.1 hypothetical protein [Zunongwangia sp. F225]